MTYPYGEPDQPGGYPGPGGTYPTSYPPDPTASYNPAGFYNPAGYPASPAGPPGFGHFGPVQPPPRKSRTGLVIGVVAGVFVLLLGVGTAVFLIVNNSSDGSSNVSAGGSAGGSSDGPSSVASDGMSPTEVADSFLAATFKDGDVDKAVGFVCSDLRESGRSEIRKLVAGMALLEMDMSWTVVDETIDGDSATVTFAMIATYTEDGETKAENDPEQPLVLKKESEWKVCDEDLLTK